jgi:pimeloyl-ACP methyl ester carboxylesterase
MGRLPDAPARAVRHARHMSQIRVNGTSLYYEEHGTGVPILCIHGTGSSTLLWRRPVAELARHGRVVVYDRRGFGRSERPEPLLIDVHQQADDAAALIEALDLAPAVVIGRSQGGEIAVDLALRYPDRVRALALLEGGGMSLSPEFARWRTATFAQVFAVAEKDVRKVGETMFRGVLGDDVWESLPEEVRQVFVSNSPAILAEDKGGQLMVTEAELRTIALPVLVVGARDSGSAFADASERTARAIPSARLEWVDGSHLIDAAHPAVLAFVDEAVAASAPVAR